MNSQDIIQTALDLMHQDVQLLVQGRHNPIFYLGTVSGAASMGDKSTVTIDNFRLRGGATMIAHQLVDADTILEIREAS